MSEQQSAEQLLATIKVASVNVAVAVIHYQQHYLLGFRNSAQHQGDRYEFVGGKIDANESATQALIREVAEEVGIDISANTAVKLGRLYHDYGDKRVCLQVYKVELSYAQYQQHKTSRYGLEGQALTWVDKAVLLAGHYRLPAANQTILTWLQLPSHLVISYPLAHFDSQKNIGEAWLSYHQQHIVKNAWVYIRTKAALLDNSAADDKIEQLLIAEQSIAEQLLQLRPDIKVLLANTANNATDQVVAYHLSHSELMHGYNVYDANNTRNHEYRSVQADLGGSNLIDGIREQQLSAKSLSAKPLIISCHDKDSIITANQLAAQRIQQQRPPVIAIFLSPVLVTQTHPDDKPLGWEAWSSLAQLADMPVIALGGLSPTMSQHAAQYGAISIAGIQQFLAASAL
jgi:8-oxo-dGTP diphosphatase